MHMEGAVRRRNAFAHRTIRRRHSPDKRSIAIPMTNSARRLRAQNNAPLALVRRDSTAHIHGRSSEATHRVCTQNNMPPAFARQEIYSNSNDQQRASLARAKQRAVGFAARDSTARAHGRSSEATHRVCTQNNTPLVSGGRGPIAIRMTGSARRLRGQNDTPLALARKGFNSAYTWKEQ